MMFHPKGKKALILAVVSVILLVFGFLLLNNFIYQEKQGEGIVTEPYQATLEGEYVCLPHRDTDGPQTLECAFGVQTDSGEYFALDFSDQSEAMTAFQTGQRATLAGTVTPNADSTSKYDIQGTMAVEEVLGGEEEQVFCTQDAKLCPDGSYVGRVPPDCEFESCPGE